MRIAPGLDKVDVNINMTHRHPVTSMTLRQLIFCMVTLADQRPHTEVVYTIQDEPEQEY